MDLFQGNTLRHHLIELSKSNNITLPKNELLYMMFVIDLCRAVEFLHGMNLIHRDIKPENIIITQNLEVKLIDFGISKKLSKENQHKNLFTTNCGKGTLIYFPPENVVNDIHEEDDFLLTQLSQSRKISKSFDIWTIGLIISEIFGNEIPWKELVNKGPNFLTIALMNKNKFPIPETIKDEKIIRIIEACTEIYPINRINIHKLIKKLIEVFVEKLKKYSVNNNVFELFETPKESKHLSLSVNTFFICRL